MRFLKLTNPQKCKPKRNHVNRAYPKTSREFTFGKVNLFKGINGVGKTSVFEGIELMLCGKSSRNVNQNNPNGCLEAVFNGVAKAELYQGTNQAIYQSRDRKWYSSTYIRGNTLYNSFNRFNYFNADAAHSFASSKTDGDVMDALYSIVLGPDFGYIQERCTKMIERIRPEYNRLKDSIDTASSETIADKKLVGAYIEPESVKYIRDKIKHEVEKISFRQPDLDISTGQTQIEDLNNQVGIALQNLSERNFQYDSQVDFNSELQKFNEKKQNFDSLLENVKRLGRDNTVMLNAQKELERKLVLLEKSMDYLTDVRYLELDGLATKLKEQRYIKNRTDFVSSLVKDIDLERFKSPTQIEELVLAEKNLLETLKRDSLTLRESISKELEKMGRVDGLIKELKAKGAEYLHAAPLATECPLCSTNFERDLLEQRINKLLGSEQLEVNKFQEDNIKLSKWADDQTALEQRIATFEKIKNAYQSFYGLDAPLGSMNEILIKIEDVIIRAEGLNRELERLNGIEEFGMIASKSESEVSSIKSSISEVFAGELEFKIGELELFKTKFLAFEKDLADKRNELEKNISVRFNIGLEIKLLLGLPTEASIDAKGAEQKLEIEKNNLDLYAGYMEKINILVELDEIGYFGEVDHLIPWQIDHLINWRPVAENASRSDSKLVNKSYNYS